MNTVKRLFAIGAAVAFCGCISKAPPTVAGGKPVSHWVAELNNPDAKHRAAAVEKLGNVGPADPAAYPAVRGALNDTDPKVRCEAILAVVKFGAAAKDAMPLLDVLRQTDRNSGVRDYAARALETLR